MSESVKDAVLQTSFGALIGLFVGFVTFCEPEYKAERRFAERAWKTECLKGGGVVQQGPDRLYCTLAGEVIDTRLTLD